MRKYAVGATLLATAIAVGAQAGTGHALPAEAGVGYTANVTEKSTIITTDAGSMGVEDGVFKIKAVDGTTLAGTELKFRVDEFEFPIAAQISDRTATLTPQLDIARASYKPVALPFEDQAPWKNQYEREQAAWSRLTSTITTGAAVGTLVGGITGSALGCLLGGIAGATVATAAIIGLFGAIVPAAVVGCVGGIVAVGAIGTLAGQLLVTAPIAIMAAVQYLTTINQPPPTPQPAK